MSDFKVIHLPNILFSITMQTKDAIFKLSLEDAGVMTTCDLTSLYCEDFDEVGHLLLY